MLQNIKLTVALISAAIFLCLPTNTQAAKFDDLTIVVSSCDKYSPLWEPFFVSLFKQWPSLQQENVSVPIALIANNSSYTSTRITMINNPNESSWSDNMLNALSQVKTKYVLIALDDYWLTAEVNEPRLLELYDGMRTEQAAMIQISYNNHNYQKGRLHPTLKNVMYTNKHAHYKASLQMAIWDKQALMFLLKPGEDPWAFELSGTARSHGYPQPFMSLSADEPIKYLNASYQGHISPEAIAFVKQNSIPFAADKFPVLGKFNYKITYNTWKKRTKKLVAFIQHPGLFYRSDS